MIVEKIILDNEKSDKFPAGLRVLAVDDDPICLKLLETLLRKCQYHVTTTSQARVALKMLRENKDRFDLVVSDVHMPDMDGFKLLELVGLEMDLPVIMLSANSDPKLVMQGITHGACDYLVKPVRIEELRNIWQHVIRRKKVDSKNQNASTDQLNAQPGSGESHISPTTENADPHGKFNRKRKDDEDDGEDDENESEDPSTQKKPRVVWSIELHRKFVAAVNHLGIEKAVPKRILDMMNVEGLTRENVASHLQKYRLYLKRISHVTTQQANMAAAFGIKDSPFMRMGSLDGLGDFRTLSGPGRLGNVALSPYGTSGILGRLNSPANMNLRNLTPTLVQPTHSPTLSNLIGKTHPVLSSSGQNPSLFQGIPSLELDQIQQKGNLNFNGTDDSKIFATANTFTDSGAVIGGSSNLFSSNGNNSMMLVGGFGNPSSNNMASFSSESFNTGITCASNLLDPSKCNETWQNTIEPPKIEPNSLLSTNTFHPQLPLNSMRDKNSSNGSYSQNNSFLASSVPPQDLRERSCQDLVSDTQNTNQTTNQRWGEQRQNYRHIPNNAFGSLNSQNPENGVISRMNRNLDHNTGIFEQKIDEFVNGRASGGVLSLVQRSESDKFAMESRVRSNENFFSEQPKLLGGFVHQSYDSLDDLMNAMIKRDETTSNCDFGFDDYAAFGQVAVEKTLV
ncbi:two-component response regulator ARR12-like isoform X2 [Henckelia pumila]|uniref:two-component response regulator ARR12-like isoform X2 n=1 Tax=Henckelia pumila TaxID=405737 RepID=UPI003C6E0CCD